MAILANVLLVLTLLVIVVLVLLLALPLPQLNTLLAQILVNSQQLVVPAVAIVPPQLL